MFLERREAPRGCVPRAAAAVGAGGRRARGGAQQWRHAAPTVAPLHRLFQALPSPTVSSRNQRSARFVHIRGDELFTQGAGGPTRGPAGGRKAARSCTRSTTQGALCSQEGCVPAAARLCSKHNNEENWPAHWMQLVGRVAAGPPAAQQQLPYVHTQHRALIVHSSQPSRRAVPPACLTYPNPIRMMIHMLSTLALV